MQRIRLPFVLVTTLTYLDRPFVQGHSLIIPSYSFPIHICTYCFIYLTNSLNSYAFYTSYFTFVFWPARNIFLIPDDAVERRKLGFQILIFTIALGLIWAFINYCLQKITVPLTRTRTYALLWAWPFTQSTPSSRIAPQAPSRQEKNTRMKQTCKRTGRGYVWSEAGVLGYFMFCYFVFLMTFPCLNKVELNWITCWSSWLLTVLLQLLVLAMTSLVSGNTWESV